MASRLQKDGISVKRLTVRFYLQSDHVKQTPWYEYIFGFDLPTHPVPAS